MDVKILVIALAVMILIVAISKSRSKIALPFIFAFFIALVWTSFYRYEYIGTNTFLLERINIYPLVLWTVGLTVLHVAYTKYLRNYSLIVAASIYVIVLCLLEAVGYYLLDIRLASNFPDLLNLGVFHAPPYVQTFYLAIGPLYLCIIHYGFKKLLRSQPRLR